MKNAYIKDIFRTIWKSKKRFLSILIITALGITVLTGIYGAVQDMYVSADQFYDEQRLFDVRVLSTLGLTDEDVDALQGVSGIETADGSYSETVHTDVAGTRKSAALTVLGKKGLNTPYVLEGRLPSAAGEVAVTQEYLEASGKALGDRLTIEETMDNENPVIGEIDLAGDADLGLELDLASFEDTPNFPVTEYVITGVVIDPMDITNHHGATSFRSTSATNYTFFITEDSAEFDVYTCIYLTLTGLADLNCFTDEYEEYVEAVIRLIETQVMQQREQARYNAVQEAGEGSIADLESEINDAIKDAEGQLAGAHADLEEGKQQLIDAEAILAGGEAALIENEKKLADARDQFEAQRTAAQEQFDQIDSAIEQVELLFAQGETELNGQIDALKAGVIPWPQAEWNALVAASARETMNAVDALDLPEFDMSGGVTIPDGWLESIDASAIAAIGTNTRAEQDALRTAVTNTGASSATAEECVAAAMAYGARQPVRDELNAQITAYKNLKAETERQFDAAEKELDDAEAQLDAARKQLEEGRAEIEDGWTELENGEAELKGREHAYINKKAQALQSIEDAYAELKNIEMTQWYVQDRTALDSHSSLKSDMASIETVGNVFPVIFLVVAVLISLTTMTRMVEEDRGLIGTYKALGFGDAAIYRKYLLYALFACLLGSLVGYFLGFIALPLFISTILEVLYVVPYYILRFDLLYGLVGALLFTVCIVGGAALSCHGELKRMPATLMRPKAPTAGKRVFLENIPFIWNRLKFLSKVTMRNLFRYKKRLLMTVFGIAGCTALVIAGFAIKDSVSELIPRQYDNIFLYDLITVAAPDDNDELLSLFDNNSDVDAYLNVQIDSVKALNADEQGESVRLMVVPTGADLSEYIALYGQDGSPLSLNDSGVVLTQNAADLLGLKAGSAVTIQTMQLDRYNTVVSGVTENYLGNMIYMTQAHYEELIGAYSPNGVLAFLSSGVADHEAYSDALLEHDYILTSSSSQGNRNGFSDSFYLINAVVYVLIVLAAGLAFVVLFTLSYTNISERTRELATIKVLGFFDNEVHSYVNKETSILTVMGIIVGLPAGRLLGGVIIGALKMPSIQFAVTIQPISYVIAAVLSFCFALIVNLMTNRTLDRINMVEALKSVE